MAFKICAAIVYDWLVAFALLFAITTACMLTNNNQAIAAGSLWYQLILSITLLLYYLTSMRYGGQTIGLRAWRLKMVSTNESLTFTTITQRLILSLPVYVFGFIFFKNPQILLGKWTKTRFIVLT